MIFGVCSSKVPNTDIFHMAVIKLENNDIKLVSQQGPTSDLEISKTRLSGRYNVRLVSLNLFLNELLVSTSSNIWSSRDTLWQQKCLRLYVENL